MGFILFFLVGFIYGPIYNTNEMGELKEDNSLYVAPEILKNHRYSDNSDLFSIGIILYQLYYGIYWGF